MDPVELLKFGGTASGLGVVAYLLLKLMERYSSIGKDYESIVKDLRTDRDYWKDRAIKCEAEAKTLRKVHKDSTK